MPEPCKGVGVMCTPAASNALSQRVSASTGVALAEYLTHLRLHALFSAPRLQLAGAAPLKEWPFVPTALGHAFQVTGFTLP
jgi:hypothetical protein